MIFGEVIVSSRIRSHTSCSSLNSASVRARGKEKCTENREGYWTSRTSYFWDGLVL